MILSLLQQAFLTLWVGWNLISGQIATPEEFYQKNLNQCNTSIVWHWDAEYQQWDFWAPDIDYDKFYVPEFFSRIIKYMYPYESYWVYCK